MAQRSLGSSLLAKTQPGSATRKTTETRVTKPEIPGKGGPGSLQRQFTEELQTQPTAPGASKNIAVSPGIESTGEVLPPTGDMMPEDQAALLAGVMGMPPQGIAPEVGSGGQNQPLFAAAPTKGGVAPKVTESRGAVTPPTPETPTPQVMGARTEVQGFNPSQYQREGLAPTVASLGGRVSAEEPGAKKSFTPTAGQFVSGAAGRLLSGIGSALNIPQLRSQGSESQRYGGAAAPALLGEGSIGRAISGIGQGISSGLRSIEQSQPARQLRSVLARLFGR